MEASEYYYDPAEITDLTHEQKPVVFPSYAEEIRCDNTKRSTAVECLRKFQLSHMLGLKSQYGSTAIRYGSMWHGFMEGFYSTIKELGWENRDKAIAAGLLLGKKKWDEATEKQTFFDDYRTIENGASAFLQYVSHFSGDQALLKVVGTERIFSLLLELKTDLEKRIFGHLPPVVFTGKIDLQVILNSLNWIIEFKTTGFALAQATVRLNRSAQVLGYSYASPVVLDFIPTGALVSHHYLYSRKVKSGDYGALSIDFARTPQVFNEFDLAEWKMSFLKACKDIWECAQHNYYPMNHDSCFNYNRQCTFYRLCTNGDDPLRYQEELPEGYIRDFWDVEKEGEND